MPGIRGGIAPRSGSFDYRQRKLDFFAYYLYVMGQNAIPKALGFAGGVEKLHFRASGDWKCCDGIEAVIKLLRSLDASARNRLRN